MRSRLLREAIARWGRATRGMTLGVRIAAFDGENRVMLVRHGYAPGWHFPGGGVESDETAVDAARRELLEETGLIASGGLRLAGLYFNPAFGGRDHVALYVAERFERGLEPPLGREIAERGWFSAEKPPSETTPATRRRLAELLGEAEPDERW